MEGSSVKPAYKQKRFLPWRHALEKNSLEKPFNLADFSCSISFNTASMVSVILNSDWYNCLSEDYLDELSPPLPPLSEWNAIKLWWKNKQEGCGHSVQLH